MTFSTLTLLVKPVTQPIRTEYIHCVTRSACMCDLLDSLPWRRRCAHRQVRQTSPCWTMLSRLCCLMNVEITLFTVVLHHVHPSFLVPSFSSCPVHISVYVYFVQWFIILHSVFVVYGLCINIFCTVLCSCLHHDGLPQRPDMHWLLTWVCPSSVVCPVDISQSFGQVL